MDNLFQSIADMSPFMKYLSVFLLSMVPLIEQRGAIPLGFALGLDPAMIFITSLVGSFAPVPIILWLFEHILAWMHKIKWLSGFVRFVDNKLRKNTPKIEKYKEIGLITFIGIPLPTTGLWTGSAIASILGLSFIKSMVCAFLGGIVSATAITVMMLIFKSLLI